MKSNNKNTDAVARARESREEMRGRAAQTILNLMFRSAPGENVEASIAEALGYLVLAGDYEPVDRNEPDTHFPSVADDATVDTLVQTVLSVGNARNKTLNVLRSALRRGDKVAALEAARQLTNLSREGGEDDER
jgi:hypothetical protein